MPKQPTNKPKFLRSLLMINDMINTIILIFSGASDMNFTASDVQQLISNCKKVIVISVINLILRKQNKYRSLLSLFI